MGLKITFAIQRQLFEQKFTMIFTYPDIFGEDFSKLAQIYIFEYRGEKI